MLLLASSLLLPSACQRRKRTDTVNKGTTTNISNQNTQSAISDGRKIFDIELHPPGRALLADVETRYGTRVREIVEDDLAFDAYYAQASISSEGAPTIQIRRETIPTEDLVVHELWHLQLGARGFAVIRMEFPATWNDDKKSHVRFLAAMIYDTIEHYIFYPKMREMGFTPDGTLREYMKSVIQEGDYEDSDGVPKRDIRTLGFFKAALLLNDPEMLTLRISKWYEDKGWQESLQISRSMISIINELKPTTPEQAVEALVRCLNVMQDQVNTFEIDRWEAVNFTAHTLKRVYVSAVPQQKRVEQAQAKTIPDTRDIKDSNRNARPTKRRPKEPPSDYRLGTIFDRIRRSMPSL